MRIINHPRCTGEIGAPSNMNDGSCAPLPMMQLTDEFGKWAVSFWKPTPDELQTLMRGGGVELHVRASGRQHPVVAMGTWPAIGPEIIDGDPHMMRSTGFRCVDCCAPEGKAHADDCKSLAAAVQRAQGLQVAAAPPAQPDGRAPLVYPPSLTPALQAALSYLHVRTGPMATVFRSAGYDIATKIEAEQAFILDRMIRTVLTHGIDWPMAFSAQLRAAQDVAIEKHEAAEAEKRKTGESA